MKGVRSTLHTLHIMNLYVVCWRTNEWYSLIAYMHSAHCTYQEVIRLVREHNTFVFQRRNASICIVDVVPQRIFLFFSILEISEMEMKNNECVRGSETLSQYMKHTYMYIFVSESSQWTFSDLLLTIQVSSFKKYHICSTNFVYISHKPTQLHNHLQPLIE